MVQTLRNRQELFSSPYPWYLQRAQNWREFSNGPVHILRCSSLPKRAVENRLLLVSLHPIISHDHKLIRQTGVSPDSVAALIRATIYRLLRAAAPSLSWYASISHFLRRLTPCSPPWTEQTQPKHVCPSHLTFAASNCVDQSNHDVIRQPRWHLPQSRHLHPALRSCLAFPPVLSISPQKLSLKSLDTLSLPSMTRLRDLGSTLRRSTMKSPLTFGAFSRAHNLTSIEPHRYAVPGTL